MPTPFGVPIKSDKTTYCMIRGTKVITTYIYSTYDRPIPYNNFLVKMDLEKLFNYFFSNFLIESLRFFFNEFALIFNNSVLSPILSTTFFKIFCSVDEKDSSKNR